MDECFQLDSSEVFGTCTFALLLEDGEGPNAEAFNKLQGCSKSECSFETRPHLCCMSLKICQGRCPSINMELMDF